MPIQVTDYRVRLLFSTLADATTANPVLLEGEVWNEKDELTGRSTGRRKIGDGQVSGDVITGTAFNDLPFEPGGAGGTPTDLSVAGVTSTAVVVVSSTGTDATLPVATDTTAGIMSGAQAAKLSGIAAGATANTVGTGPGTVAAGDDSRFHDSVTLAASVADILGLTGQQITADDPGGDRLVFWDDSEGKLTHLDLGTNLSITGTTINASGGGAAALDDLTDVVITTPSAEQVLKYNGTSWVNAAAPGGGGGTVSSVGLSVPTGLSVSGSPVTTSGTLAVTYAAGYAIPTTAKQSDWDTAFSERNQWDGGATGLVAATGRTSLGLGSLATQNGTFSGTSSGTNTGDQDLSSYLTSAAAASAYQPLDSDLTAIAALTTTSYGRSQLALADAAADTAQLDAFTTTTKGLVPAPGTATGKVLSDAGTWVVLGGGGDALVANPLSQFAATTSAQLAGVITDETGSGSLVFANSPALSGATVSTSSAITAGTNAQGQSPLTADLNIITTATSSPSGATLPVPTQGRLIIVVNRGGNTVNIYPSSGCDIDGQASNTPTAVLSGQRMSFAASDSDSWFSSRYERTDVAAVTGVGTGITSFLTTPSSASLAAAVTDETGTGSLVFANSPTLTTPDLGTPSAIVLTNGTDLPAAGVTGLGSLATQSAIGSISSAGAIGSTANLPIITGASGVLGVGSFGTTANTFCQGDDSRLSDARTPTAHNQAWSTITSTPTTLSGYGIADAQPLDSDLTSIAALTTTSFGRSFLDRADAAAGRTLLDLGTLATQSGTFSGTSSGTNSGDQTIANTSDGTSHTITLSAAGGSVQLVEGSNITLTTTGTSGAGVVTIASTAGGGGNTFSTVAVSGQSDVVADTSTDTLTLVAGANVTLTTDAGADSITIASAAPTTFSHSTITYAATVDLDMAALTGLFRTISLTGNLTFTTSNRATGRLVTIRLLSDGSSRTLSFPAGWVFVGAKPTAIAANKTAALSLSFFGTADTDCVAAYSVQT